MDVKSYSKKRMLNLSPTVKAGLEIESKKSDFNSEGDRAVGKGGFGKVWKVRHLASNKIFAIKIIPKQTILESNMVEQMNREIEIMYRLHHPHIIKLVNHFEDEDNIYLVMNFASKGQLYSQLKRQGKFDQRTVAQYMREIISALKYLHAFDPPIIHRDIKPENILIDENSRLKLCDFGWSNYEGKNKRTTYCGTPDYLAPEMIKKEGHDTRVDIWYLGVLMFELLTGFPPFSGTNQDELFSNIKKIKINWPDDFPSYAKNLISKILKQNPKERITLDEILEHPWFEKNPILKPALKVEVLDQKSYLESLMLNRKQETTLTVENNKASINSESPLIKRVSRLNSIMSKNEKILDSSLVAQNHDHEESKKYEELKIKCDKYFQENIEIKQKYEKNENELKFIRNELNKVTSVKYQMESDLQKLKEELDRYKIMNKDRLVLLTEIEEKNNELIELRNKAKYLENEVETVKRNLKLSNEKIIDSEKVNEFLVNKQNECRKEIDSILKEKEYISLNYQQKIKVLEAKIFDPSTFDDSGPSVEKLMEMILDSLSEIKYFFKQKIDNLEKILLDCKDECNLCENKINDIIKDRTGSIIEYLSKLRNTFEDNFNKIKEKVDKDGNIQNKANERIDWLKKQISELMQFKSKSAALENQIIKVEEKIKLYHDQAISSKEAKDLVLKINSEQEENMRILKRKMKNLEDRLSDCKDFIFKFCSDKLDDFQKCYRF